MIDALQAAAGPQVQGQGVDDERPFTAELVSLTAAHAELRPIEGQPRMLLRADLWWLTVGPPETGAAPVTAPPTTLLLANGDRLRVESLEIRDDTAFVTRADLPADARVSVPLESLQAVIFDESGSMPRRPVQRWLLLAPVTRDVVLLRNGDRIDGELRALTETECLIAAAAGETPIERRRLAGIAFNRELITKPAATARSVRVQLHDGSLITASEVITGDGACTITGQAGFELALPFASVERLDFLGERVVALSALPVLEDRSRGYLMESVPLEIDRNAAGGPLRLPGEGGRWGLGVWSGSDLTWELPAGAARFHAVAGLDLEAQTAGSVEFIVRLDDREAVRSGRRTGQDGPLEIGPVSLADVRRLQLVVEFSDRGDVLDLANWLRPTLLMKANPGAPQSATTR